MHHPLGKAIHGLVSEACFKESGFTGISDQKAI